jgi:hypothetical protein
MCKIRLPLGNVALGLRTLAFKYDTLQFLKDDKLLVRVVNLGITLLFGNQKASFFEPLEFALDVTGVFFDKFSQTADMGLEIWVLGIDHNDLAPYSGGNKNV